MRAPSTGVARVRHPGEPDHVRGGVDGDDAHDGRPFGGPVGCGRAPGRRVHAARGARRRACEAARGHPPHRRRPLGRAATGHARRGHAPRLGSVAVAPGLRHARRGGVDNVVRFARLRFHGRLMDDARADEVEALVSHARAALADGIPVPLYVSGDSDRRARGRGAAARGAAGGRGRRRVPHLRAVERGRASASASWCGGGKAAALGNWNRVAWAVLPRLRGA